ncbi:transcriptional regulator, partial [Micromonospora sp. NPDC000207]
EPDRALAAHARVVGHPGYAHLPLAVRADHQVDTARAYVLLGDVVAAGRTLLAADRTAPAEVRSRPAAREVVALVLRRSVRPDPRLVDLGRACGVDGAR